MIELMVSIAVFAIIITVAVPGFQGLIMNNRLTAESNRFFTTLMFARSEAIKRGVRVTVCKTDDHKPDDDPKCDSTLKWESGWLVFLDLNVNGNIDADETILRVESGLHANYTLRTGENLKNWVAFLPSGETRGNGGLATDTFRLCGPDANTTKARSIVMNTVGRLSVRKGTEGKSCL